MQPNQQERRFAENPQQQPVYRFPQNQPTQGWQPQQSFDGNAPRDAELPPHRKASRAQKQLHPRRRRRIFTLWNLFAVIGIITVIIEGLRYVIIPFLVYLNVLTGGAL